MGLLHRVANVLHSAARSLENPRKPLSELSDNDLEAMGGGSRSSSGVRVSYSTALTHSPVWRGINLLSRDVAKLPLLVFQREGEGKRRAPEHRSYQLLRRKPNREMTAFVFKQTLVAHALLEGNGLAYIFRRGDGTPEELIPLVPGKSYPVRESGQLWYVTEVNGEWRKLYPENIFHLKGLSFDGLSGYRVIDKARESLGLGLAARDYGSRFFKNDARPGVVIEHPTSLSEAAATRLKAQWNAMHSGLDNAHRTAVLEEGMKINKFSSTARESQLIQTREFDIVEVANWIGVPAHKIGDKSRTAYASLEQENQSYLDDSLDPWLVNFEDEAQEKLLTEEEKQNDSHTIEFVRQALLRANLVDRANYYRVALGGRPWMKQNEVRALENLNPVDNGDTILDPLNMKDPGGNPDDPATGATAAKKPKPKKPGGGATADDELDDEEDDNDTEA